MYYLFNIPMLKIPIYLIIINTLFKIIKAIPHAADILDERILVNFLAMYVVLFIITILM